MTTVATMESFEARIAALDSAHAELLAAIRSVEATQRVLADALREFSMTRNTAEDTNHRVRGLEQTTAAIKDRVTGAPDS